MTFTKKIEKLGLGEQYILYMAESTLSKVEGLSLRYIPLTSFGKVDRVKEFKT